MEELKEKEIQKQEQQKLLEQARLEQRDKRLQAVAKQKARLKVFAFKLLSGLHSCVAGQAGSAAPGFSRGCHAREDEYLPDERRDDTT